MFKLRNWIHRHFPAIKRRALKKVWDKSGYDERLLMFKLGLTPKR